jgi:hypothetical protein
MRLKLEKTIDNNQSCLSHTVWLRNADRKTIIASAVDDKYKIIDTIFWMDRDLNVFRSNIIHTHVWGLKDIVAANSKYLAVVGQIRNIEYEWTYYVDIYHPTKHVNRIFYLVDKLIPEELAIHPSKPYIAVLAKKYMEDVRPIHHVVVYNFKDDHMLYQVPVEGHQYDCEDIGFDKDDLILVTRKSVITFDMYTGIVKRFINSEKLGYCSFMKVFGNKVVSLKSRFAKKNSDFIIDIVGLLDNDTFEYKTVRIEESMIEEDHLSMTKGSKHISHFDEIDTTFIYLDGPSVNIVVDWKNNKAYVDENLNGHRFPCLLNKRGKHYIVTMSQNEKASPGKIGFNVFLVEDD